ncbi:SDR family oxidoreductase [Glycomyces sp. A-F 0318]|uniref:SDR family oxidoreductase n=1 Tax=Glycomyces amatae TaxID=2881355 RepID=UPI001E384437|nr:SDR family oxidoreductase [Glycomyces amatae]MCD0443174.1 SDR family oxidoreductase [Glycomyces amatae]
MGEDEDAELAWPSGAEPQYRCTPGGADAPLVLLLGGTGYIGGRLLPRLLNAGYRVRLLTRNPERAHRLAVSGAVEVLSGDAADRRAVASAMRGAQVVYHLIHSMTGGRDFRRLDRMIARNVADAAAAAGVGRIVYLGGLAPRSGPLSEHLASRREVGRILARSGVPVLVLQAGVVIGSGSASFEMIRHLTEVLPVMPAPRWVRNRIQPIAIRDVLHYLLRAAAVPEAGVFDIGGPDVLRYDEMMNGYARLRGLPRRRIWALPVLTPRLASHWVGLVTPIPRNLALPLVDSLQHHCVMHDHRIDRVVPPPDGGLTGYREALRLALGRMEVDRIETSWADVSVAGAPSDPLPSDPDWAGRVVYTDARELVTAASPEALWRVISGIGGANGWYSTPLLWALRGWADRAVGGVGLRRGRRSRADPRVGDVIDFWRVETCEPGRLLRLRAEMRLPGLAWLELSCEERPTRYRQRAVFFPRGLSGRLYWFAVLPFHGVVFTGMARRIVAMAERERRGPGRAGPGSGDGPRTRKNASG